MSRQDDYRRNAELAREMAERVASEEDKASWRRVAAGWLSLLGRRPTAHGKQHFDDQVQALRTGQPESGALR